MDDQGKLEIIKQNIESFPNFPKNGILFRDIFSALTKGEVCMHLRDLMVAAVREKFPRAEMIVGLESRGFLFNLMIAAELGIGCAPIRKKGKLPGNCVSVEYTLEYGKDIFEIQTKAIKPNQRVVIVDDLLATGGSLEAAIKLVKKAGGEVLGSLVVMELVDLNGRDKLGCCTHSLIKYKCN